MLSLPFFLSALIIPHYINHQLQASTYMNYLTKERMKGKLEKFIRKRGQEMYERKK